MKKLIKLKDRHGEIIHAGKYKNIRELVENNKAYLGYAYLKNANLGYASLENANLGYANLGYANLRYANLENANLGYASLRYTCLENANLRNAYLENANLRNASLENAYLKNIKGYSESHAIFIELIQRQKTKIFLQSEWSCISQIIVYRLCWISIKKRFPRIFLGIAKKLSKVGFDEYEKRFKEILKG